MAAQDDMEQKVTQLVAQLSRDFGHLGDDLTFTVVRALIHRAVHLGAESKRVEYCALSTYLAEMIAHAHKLAHGENPKAAAHKDMVH